MGEPSADPDVGDAIAEEVEEEEAEMVLLVALSREAEMPLPVALSRLLALLRKGKGKGDFGREGMGASESPSVCSFILRSAGEALPEEEENIVADARPPASSEVVYSTRAL